MMTEHLISKLTPAVARKLVMASSILPNFVIDDGLRQIAEEDQVEPCYNREVVQYVVDHDYRCVVAFWKNRTEAFESIIETIRQSDLPALFVGGQILALKPHFKIYEFSRTREEKYLIAPQIISSDFPQLLGQRERILVLDNGQMRDLPWLAKMFPRIIMRVELDPSQKNLFGSDTERAATYLYPHNNFQSNDRLKKYRLNGICTYFVEKQLKT